ncbi:MAG: type II secretion system GspH family protein [Pirellulales bacterium]|nr:type II secretion system GspH family protein [Pirellulales bacterium]
MQLSPTRAPRAGFTLIELLMVIFLIGILATILGYAANKALRTARQTRILAEIEQLNTAVETYKSERGSYPPTWGNFLVESQSANAKRQRIQRHVSKSFPRYTGDYNAIRTQISLATAYVPPNYTQDVAAGRPLALTYTAQAAGLPGGGLDIENLDPAETLVFWLGGLPDPTSATKLAGFRADATSPFVDASQVGAPQPVPASQLPGRTPPAYRFDPSRLVDRDGDGWWEYLQAGAKADDNVPPLVYFDNLVYGLSVSYPAVNPPSGTAGNEAASHAMQWGTILPYASDGPSQLNPTKLVTWVNSQTYQIIACGLDGQYDSPSDTRTPVNQNPGFNAIDDLEYWPSGRNFEQEDYDNLTNFHPGPLSDAF